MQVRKSVLSVLLLGFGISGSVLAADVSIKGTLPGVVQLRDVNAFGPVTKQIIFQRVILSPAAKQALAARLLTTKIAAMGLTAAPLPAQASLGMNNVPVLDQGYHGTCVTFAVTGAYDAAMGETIKTASDDHYSELCSLELGSTLEAQSPVDANGEHTYPSGWDGSWATIVLGQVKQHGLVTIEDQKTRGCSGVYEYPLHVENDHGRAMSIADYQGHSVKSDALPSYKVILNPDDAFSDGTNLATVLTQVKAAVAAGHRVVFGTLLDVDRGANGALGSYKASNDTWMLTPDIAKDAKAGSIEAGHEMIITGYDDEAVVMGPKKEKHKGVLTLRNSWSEEAGDHGNYYMTYDHFKTLTLEASEITPVVTK